MKRLALSSNKGAVDSCVAYCFYGELQSIGEFTTIEVTHNPFVAVKVTLVPTVIPVTVFPIIVPELTDTAAPAEALKAKL
jgi:hypothetical protein